MKPLDATPKRYGKAPNPCCVRHRVQLQVRSVLPRVRYLYCPVPGCKSRCKLPRPSDDTNPDVL